MKKSVEKSSDHTSGTFSQSRRQGKRCLGLATKLIFSPSLFWGRYMKISVHRISVTTRTLLEEVIIAVVCCLAVVLHGLTT